MNWKNKEMQKTTRRIGICNISVAVPALQLKDRNQKNQKLHLCLPSHSTSVRTKLFSKKEKTRHKATTANYSSLEGAN